MISPVELSCDILILETVLGNDKYTLTSRFFQKLLGNFCHAFRIRSLSGLYLDASAVREIGRIFRRGNPIFYV